MLPCQSEACTRKNARHTCSHVRLVSFSGTAVLLVHALARPRVLHGIPYGVLKRSMGYGDMVLDTGGWVIVRFASCVLMDDTPIQVGARCLAGHPSREQSRAEQSKAYALALSACPPACCLPA